MFLRCSANNLAETVLELFLDAVKMDGNLWPSRIRVDKGVENVLVCDAMIQARGEGRGSFIAGPSTHNQRHRQKFKTFEPARNTAVLQHITRNGNTVIVADTL